VLRMSLGREHFSNGMAARLLVARPPRRQSRWSEAEVRPAVEWAVDSLVRQLRGLSFAVDDRGDEMPVNLPLDADSKTEWIKFVEEHSAEQFAMEDERLRAALVEAGSIRRELALVDHLVRWATDPLAGDAGRVGVQSIEAGITLARWFGHEDRRVYGMLGETDDERRQRELVELVREMGGNVSIRDLQHKRRRYRNHPGVAQADLQILVDAKLGDWRYRDTRGRPSQAFFLFDGNGVNVNETPDGDSANGSYVDVDVVDGAEDIA
jgi:hypothetical protein